MKQKDIVTIVFICGVSALLSILVARLLIATPKNRQQKVEVVQPISAQFGQPDTKIFNQNAINPTQNIKIGNDNNTKPFSAGGQ